MESYSIASIAGMASALSSILIVISAIQIAEASAVVYAVRFQGYIGPDLWKALLARENGDEEAATKTANRLVEKHVIQANQWADALKPTSFQLELVKPLVLLKTNENGVIVNRPEARCKIAANLGLFKKLGKMPAGVDLRHMFSLHGVAKGEGCAVGLAFAGTACRRPGWAYSVGIVKLEGLDSEAKFKASAYTFAHEIGHQVGIGHSCYRPETAWKNPECSEILKKHMENSKCKTV